MPGSLAMKCEFKLIKTNWPSVFNTCTIISAQQMKLGCLFLTVQDSADWFAIDFWALFPDADVSATFRHGQITVIPLSSSLTGARLSEDRVQVRSGTLLKMKALNWWRKHLRHGLLALMRFVASQNEMVNKEQFGFFLPLVSFKELR